MNKTIEDLDDNLLTQILFRLGSCQSVIACSPVNKRWCSLISDPKFGVLFSDYKKEIYSLCEPGSNIDDDEPPWTFIANLLDDFPTSVCNTSNNEAVFGSPKFSMEYLPCEYFEIKATFKDLVLCSRRRSRGDSKVRELYITNPVTKQWVALPPCPFEYSAPRAALVCQEPYGRDYKFRVVLITPFPEPVYEMLVYCSEIGKWKRFNLSVPIKPHGADQYFTVFEIVVCNNIIYIHEVYFVVAFNPFDVDESTDTTTIEPKLLPSLPNRVDDYMLGRLYESSGQLFISTNPSKEQFVTYTIDGRAIESDLKIWKLDPNQVPLTWKTAFQGLCTGDVNPRPFLHRDYVRNFRMHSNNDKLIYMPLPEVQQLVVCDTRTKLIKLSKSLPLYSLLPFHKLELQWWPTLVPKIYLSLDLYSGRARAGLSWSNPGQARGRDGIGRARLGWDMLYRARAARADGQLYLSW